MFIVILIFTSSCLYVYFVHVFSMSCWSFSNWLAGILHMFWILILCPLGVRCYLCLLLLLFRLRLFECIWHIHLLCCLCFLPCCLMNLLSDVFWVSPLSCSHCSTGTSLWSSGDTPSPLPSAGCCLSRSWPIHFPPVLHDVDLDFSFTNSAVWWILCLFHIVLCVGEWLLKFIQQVAR